MAVLRPVDMRMQPAPYEGRMKVIHKILEQLQKYRPRKANLEGLAVQWEHEVAKRSSSKHGYMFNASLLLRDIARHKGNLNRQGRYEAPAPQVSKAEVLAALRNLVLSEQVLSENGYVTAQDALESAAEEKEGLETCVRCLKKFDVRDIMVPTQCQFHVLKEQYNKDMRTFQYRCCGEIGTSCTPFALGCKTLEHHVFRPCTYAAMSKLLPFRNTRGVEGETNVLALDCEMAYTSCGYELIRLTVVEFWTNAVLFDEIVQPLGEIIDLNTQFSGVHEIDRAVAKTFEEAREVFLSPAMINENSILIGHGLENDLNVLRIIHDKIIDTAILYPNGKFKSSLRNLAFQELSRRIQTGEHDSSEDAIAAMDVVKHKLGIPLDRKTW
ncbi:AGR052Cp [Eremothecium gossypii ATCC 10895]|uniref:RNA exonuclease 3 n=1 Tax=Eremothecium gossypii (strain ATCC 10895 / CBS 109.51 / FGSC 9923 / NRRL Y-1056) TaxID=284811 RepID=REXO3_EREGS|nr:AGR052Cp [Eremothecium gossypii ATCC 10895]Q750A5.1 RecName: Full=RNA exonuclease 3 [Eremothecium gossypii ATCC 10895]AAS54541.1 AGR052Cp [Eremothecium gossypii ATCC 10895]AEY98873.1 FAGR052Cp [Eremothecium gossypii FDAG1]